MSDKDCLAADELPEDLLDVDKGRRDADEVPRLNAAIARGQREKEREKKCVCVRLERETDETVDKEKELERNLKRDLVRTDTSRSGKIRVFRMKRERKMEREKERKGESVCGISRHRTV